MTWTIKAIMDWLLMRRMKKKKRGVKEIIVLGEVHLKEENE
jgi:hypothetical protein